MGKLRDLTGMRFGRLIVMERGENRIKIAKRRGKVPVVRWKCQCECGNILLVDANSLTSGNTRSCGCLKEEVLHRTKNRKPNRYELHDEYVVGYLSSGVPFIFDREDYEKVSQYSWHVGTREGYLMAMIYGTKKSILLHRLIMNEPDGMVVDHMNHDPLDNRKCNLRLVTFSQNQMNRNQICKAKSGVTGVYQNRRSGKWMAYISVGGHQKNLGLYDEFDDAVKARKEGEQEYFGEYSYDNSIAAVPKVAV